jgi:hypothetical protein
VWRGLRVVNRIANPTGELIEVAHQQTTLVSSRPQNTGNAALKSSLDHTPRVYYGLMNHIYTYLCACESQCSRSLHGHNAKDLSRSERETERERERKRVLKGTGEITQSKGSKLVVTYLQLHINTTMCMPR